MERQCGGGLFLENMINPGSLNAANPITWFTEHSHIQKQQQPLHNHTIKRHKHAHNKHLIRKAGHMI